MAKAVPSYCSRDSFLDAIGVVNADVITEGERGGLKVKTTYPGVAERVEGMGKAAGCRVLRTVAENEAKPWLPIYVVTVKGFRKEVKA